MNCRTPSNLSSGKRRATLISSLVVGVITASILGGAAVAVAHNPDGDVDSALEHGQIALAIARGEAAVSTTPRDAALRVKLGRAYLKAGRFESAAAMFSDARTLGDTSGKTALDLALAEIGIGSGRDALAVLDSARDRIPVSDYGLAVALAGDTSRGVAVLTDDLRDGDATPRLRQNLGFADALDGRWNDARIITSIDLSPDRLDQRLQQWAMVTPPEAYRQRVALLLGSPVRSDIGEPASLALGNLPSSAPEAASMMSASMPKPEVTQTQATAFADSVTPAAQPALPVAAVDSHAHWAVIPRIVAFPVIEKLPWTASFAELERSKALRHRVAPQIRHAPVHMVMAQKSVPHTVRTATQRTGRVEAETGNWMVQLGSFGSAEMAEHARHSFMHQASIAAHSLVVTEAIVRGRRYWRVAATEFNKGAAGGQCESIRRRGGVCLTYAQMHQPGGVVLAVAERGKKSYQRVRS